MHRSLIAAIVSSLALASFAYGAEPTKADRLLIEKAARRLTLFANGSPIRTYIVSLGGNPVGPKQRQGDERTPEGLYSINARNSNSSFHRSLQISYPNAQDRARAASAGVDPGGLIMIHGIRNGLGWVGRLHRFFDWTDGCIAVTDAEMDEIWEMVEIGTAVEIKP
jgi:murein L,D-transpeptidase YafK